MKTLSLKWISLAVLGAALSFAGCGESSSSGTGGMSGAGGTAGTGGSPPGSGGTGVPTVSFSGIAWSFELPGTPYGRIAEAKISILEMPEIETTSNMDGEFTIDGLPVGSQATLVLEHQNHPLTYTKTHSVPDTDLDDVTFQIPTNLLFAAIAKEVVDAGLVEGIDPTKCQMVSTFTRYGKTIGDQGHHGEPGALLSIDPANTAESGPLYFNDEVLPDPGRSYSSLDGGVLLLNAEPGEYTLSASCVEDPDLMDAFIAEYPPEANMDQSLRCQTEHVVFESILMKCEAGVFLNASPSYGLQALEPLE
jgi:hypothetical protein